MLSSSTDIPCWTGRAAVSPGGGGEAGAVRRARSVCRADSLGGVTSVDAGRLSATQLGCQLSVTMTGIRRVDLRPARTPRLRLRRCMPC